jgi:hypothetical protein
LNVTVDGVVTLTAAVSDAPDGTCCVGDYLAKTVEVARITGVIAPQSLKDGQRGGAEVVVNIAPACLANGAMTIAVKGQAFPDASATNADGKTETDFRQLGSTNRARLVEARWFGDTNGPEIIDSEGRPTGESLWTCYDHSARLAYYVDVSAQGINMSANSADDPGLVPEGRVSFSGSGSATYAYLVNPFALRWRWTSRQPFCAEPVFGKVFNRFGTEEVAGNPRGPYRSYIAREESYHLHGQWKGESDGHGQYLTTEWVLRQLENLNSGQLSVCGGRAFETVWKAIQLTRSAVVAEMEVASSLIDSTELRCGAEKAAKDLTGIPDVATFACSYVRSMPCPQNSPPYARRSLSGQ